MIGRSVGYSRAFTRVADPYPTIPSLRQDRPTLKDHAHLCIFNPAVVRIDRFLTPGARVREYERLGESSRDVPHKAGEPMAGYALPVKRIRWSLWIIVGLLTVATVLLSM